MLSLRLLQVFYLRVISKSNLDLKILCSLVLFVSASSAESLTARGVKSSRLLRLQVERYLTSMKMLLRFRSYLFSQIFAFSSLFCNPTIITSLLFIERTHSTLLLSFSTSSEKFSTTDLVTTSSSFIPRITILFFLSSFSCLSTYF